MEVPVVKLGADLTAESGVTWTLTDPTAQVLVLHAALDMHGVVHALDDAVPGNYVDFAGKAEPVIIVVADRLPLADFRDVPPGA